MKNIFFLVLGLVIACNSSQKTVSKKLPANPTVYAETITEAELKEHLYIYASDEFEGRETGAEGQKKAIAYLKSQYEGLAIPAAKADGDYFQKVPLEVAKLPTGYITFNEKDYAIGDDFVCLSAIDLTIKEVIYVGYGIKEGDYSDYTDLDLTGKTVLIKAGEPKNENGSYLLSGNDTSSDWSKPFEGLSKKGKLALDLGAKGVLFYDAKNYHRLSSYYNRTKDSDSGRITLKQEGDDNFELYLSEHMAKSILPTVDENDNAQLISIAINIAVKSSSKLIDSENVAAVLKGSEKPHEYIVISSHLDHIGVSSNGEINNGADDDGSGSVALLEIAEAFKNAANAGDTPKRSIVFLHVTGEEKGLLGSQYYTDSEPIFPLEQTVANLNIDMIGRIDPKRTGDRNYIYLIGSDKLSTDLHELSEEINDRYMKIELDYKYNDDNDPNRFYYRSDHYNFAKNNIPIIFYFNGTHDDYHKPSDTPDKINYDLLENRTRLVFHTAWEVANRDERIVVDNPID